MKLQLMSDLHLEHHMDGGREFIASLNPKSVDLLVLAGDIGTINCINLAIELFCKKYKEVIFVKGNHSYYRSNREDVLNNFNSLKRQFPNFHLLDNEILELDGKRFLGSTLWYPFVNYVLTWHWSDFKQIKGLDSWVYEDHKKSVKFFEENLKEDDIVITHMLPSFKCIAEKYNGLPENVFYACNLDYLIEERKPKLWICAHTHTHIDMKIGETNIIANPRGYTMYHESLEMTGFNDRLIIEV